MEGKRILAIDYGTKRIGIALSDELGWTAQPLETLNRRTLDRDIAHIASLVGTHEVSQVLLGFPLQLDGREGPAIQAMREFQARLEAGSARSRYSVGRTVDDEGGGRPLDRGRCQPEKAEGCGRSHRRVDSPPELSGEP